MSEWEEFCDDHSMPYDWVYEGSDPISDNSESPMPNYVGYKYEIESSVDEAKLREVLLSSLGRPQFFKLSIRDRNSDIPCATNAIDGAKNDQIFPDLYVAIESAQTYSFPVSMFVRCLKDFGFPIVETDFKNLISWDAESRCVNVKPYFHQTDVQFQAPRGGGLLPENFSLLEKLIFRSWLTTDHGKKPLLIADSQIDSIKLGHRVNIVDPQHISFEDFSKFGLAFITPAGDVAVKALSNFDVNQPISTRYGTYYADDKRGLRKPFNADYLLRSALDLITMFEQSDLFLFIEKRTINIYESSVDRLMFKFSLDEHGLQRLEEVFNSSWANNLGFYVTSGNHPFENVPIWQGSIKREMPVTTLGKYLEAIKKLSTANCLPSYHKNNDLIIT